MNESVVFVGSASNTLFHFLISDLSFLIPLLIASDSEISSCSQYSFNTETHSESSLICRGEILGLEVGRPIFLGAKMFPLSFVAHNNYTIL